VTDRLKHSCSFSLQIDNINHILLLGISEHRSDHMGRESAHWMDMLITFIAQAGMARSTFIYCIFHTATLAEVLRRMFLWEHCYLIRDRCESESEIFTYQTMGGISDSAIVTDKGKTAISSNCNLVRFKWSWLSNNPRGWPSKRVLIICNTLEVLVHT
jgi:hypothetical protein